MTGGRTVNSISQDWCTPPKYVKAVKNFFGGTVELDPCSNINSIVEAEVEYMLPRNNGLEESWNYQTIYVNPPYGVDRARKSSIKNWIERCAKSYLKYKSEVLALIPVAVNTKHWKEHIFGVADSICFLSDTRLKFINGTKNKGAPMACAMVYWGKHGSKFYKIFSKYGAVVDITSLKKKGWVSPDLINKTRTLF